MAQPAARVLILTTFDLDEYVYDALGAGASGFLLKDSSPEQLVTAIRVIAGGEALLAPSVTSRLIEQFARTRTLRQEPPPGLDELTTRELEVFKLVARGLSNAETRPPWSSATARSRLTSPACSPSSACATASRWSCSPTSPGS